MKAKFMALIAAVLFAGVSAGCRQQTEFTRDERDFFAPETPSGEEVETSRSSAGDRKAIYDPPEKTILDFGDKFGRYIYRYTYATPMNHMPVDMGGLDFVWIQYCYADENHEEYEIILDQYDRIAHISMMGFGRTEGWIVEELTEESFTAMAEEMMETLGIPLSYETKSFSENNLGYDLRFIRREDTPLETADQFHFDEEGRFLYAHFSYGDIEEISESDEKYFSNTLNAYLKKHPVNGKEVERSVHYGVYNRVIVATFTIIWADDDGAKWAETYSAGKPF